MSSDFNINKEQAEKAGACVTSSFLDDKEYEMTEPGEIVKRYVEGLTLRREEKEEVENVILGYIADCTAKDKRIEELEIFLRHIQKMILHGYVTLGDEKNGELKRLVEQ